MSKKVIQAVKVKDGKLFFPSGVTVYELQQDSDYSWYLMPKTETKEDFETDAPERFIFELDHQDKVRLTTSASVAYTADEKTNVFLDSRDADNFYELYNNVKKFNKQEYKETNVPYAYIETPSGCDTFWQGESGSWYRSKKLAYLDEQREEDIIDLTGRAKPKTFWKKNKKTILTCLKWLLIICIVMFLYRAGTITFHYHKNLQIPTK